MKQSSSKHKKKFCIILHWRNQLPPKTNPKNLRSLTPILEVRTPIAEAIWGKRYVLLQWELQKNHEATHSYIICVNLFDAVWPRQPLSSPSEALATYHLARHSVASQDVPSRFVPKRNFNSNEYIFQKHHPYILDSLRYGDPVSIKCSCQTPCCKS